MKKTLILALSFLLCVQSFADNRIFEDKYNSLPDKETVFKVGGEWFPYPEYTDREGWDKLLKGYKNALIKRAEKFLDYKWQPLEPSRFLEFEKTGNRALMKPEDRNRSAINSLMLGELAEGKGRFLPKLIDVLWLECGRASWQTAAHSGRQPSGRHLPTPKPESQAIELHSSYLGSSAAVCWHFFHKEFDKIDPSISETIQAAVKWHIFDPYMSKDLEKFCNWMGLGKQTHAINNWNPTCNTHVFIAFMLMEQDQQALNKAIERIFLTVDNYLSYIKPDGCCDEGPSYWRMAAGKVYELARYVCDASGGKVNVLDDPYIRRAGEFRSKIDLGDGWVMSFGDGSARTSKLGHLIFRYGKDIGSREMMDYAIYNIMDRDKGKFDNKIPNFGEIMYPLEFIRYSEDLKNYEKEVLAEAGGNFEKLHAYLRRNVANVWYPDTKQALFRNGKGWTLAVKGGHNEESHNHNDVGSCILFVDDCPVLIDPGTATYGKDTFGPNRYSLWHISALSHNIPSINGEIQQYGKQFASSKDKCDTAAATFSADICKAYPEESLCRSWNRAYRLGKDKLLISDSFVLGRRKAADQERFTVRADVEIKKGYVLIKSKNFKGDRSVTMKMSYPSCLTPSVEVHKLTDPRQTQVWGDELKTIVFSSKPDAPVSGKYEFTVTRQ